MRIGRIASSMSGLSLTRRRGDPQTLQALGLAPLRASVSPHDLFDWWIAKYGRTLNAFWPVVDTAIGRLGIMMAMEGNYPKRPRLGHERRRGGLPSLVTRVVHSKRYFRDLQSRPAPSKTTCTSSLPISAAATSSPKVKLRLIREAANR